MLNNIRKQGKLVITRHFRWDLHQPLPLETRMIIFTKPKNVFSDISLNDNDISADIVPSPGAGNLYSGCMTKRIPSIVAGLLLGPPKIYFSSYMPSIHALNRQRAEGFTIHRLFQSSHFSHLFTKRLCIKVNMRL